MLSVINPTHRIKREFVYHFLNSRGDIKNEVIFQDVCDGVLEVQKNLVVLHTASTFNRNTDFTFFAYEIILIKKILNYDEAEINVKWLDAKYKVIRDIVFQKNLRYKPTFKGLDLGFVDTVYSTKSIETEFWDNCLLANVEFEASIPVIRPGMHAEQELFYTGFYNIEAEALSYNTNTGLIF